MLFFILSHQVIVVIISSLMKGVAWQVYNTIHKKHEENKKNRIQEEQHELAVKKRSLIF